MALMLVFSQAFSRPYFSFAEDNKYPFDKVNVVDDLSSIDGFDFDLYQTLEQGGISLLNFVEYGYSPYYVNNYALYVYLFNGILFDISVSSLSNTIQFATEYDDDGNAVSYEKFLLIFCNKSDDGLFYKFRVEDSEDKNGNTFFNRVSAEKRIYDFTSIDLVKNGDTNATAFDVGGHFEFTGFGETLSCRKSSSIETIKLDVHNTYYRTESSWKSTAEKNNYQTEVDSVYFSIPNYYLEQYGNLQKITASWYEYTTSPIIVCNDLTKYNALKNYVGVDIGGYSSSVPYSLAFLIFASSQSSSTANEVLTGLSYNIDGVFYLCIDFLGLQIPTFFYNETESTFELNCLDYLLYTANSNLQSENWRNEILVSSSDLENYIRTYKKDGSELLTIDSGTLCKDLFDDSIIRYLNEHSVYGNGWEMLSFNLRDDISHYDGDTHHKLVEFDCGDSFDLLSQRESMTTLDFIKEWFGKILGTKNGYSTEVSQLNNKYILYDTEKTKEIESVFDNYNLVTQSQDIAHDLLINENDVVKFKEFYDVSSLKDETTVLFRFAVSDYYAEQCHNDNNFLLAFENCFFDFDVISLTFSQDGVYKTIPVTSSPIDIINDITPDTQFVIHSFWEKLLAWAIYILAVIIAVIVAFVLVKLLFKTARIENLFVRYLILLLLILLLCGLAFLCINYVLPWLSNKIAFLGGL